MAVLPPSEGPTRRIIDPVCERRFRRKSPAVNRYRIERTLSSIGKEGKTDMRRARARVRGSLRRLNTSLLWTVYPSPLRE